MSARPPCNRSSQIVINYAGPVQAFVDLATCVLAAGIASRLAADAPVAARGRVATVALWLTALCPFTANYAAVPLTEVYIPRVGLTLVRISRSSQCAAIT